MCEGEEQEPEYQTSSRGPCVMFLYVLLFGFYYLQLSRGFTVMIMMTNHSDAPVAPLWANKTVSSRHPVPAELQTYEPDCQHPENTLPMSPDSLSFICLTTQEVIRDPQFILFGWSPAGFHPFPDSRGHAVSFRAELVILFGFKDVSTAAGALLFFSWRHRWNM